MSRIQNQKINELEQRLELFEAEQAEDDEIARQAKEYEKNNPELKKVIEDYLQKELAKQLKKRLTHQN